MKDNIILFFFLFAAGLAGAQTIDKERMQRDIEVTENILASLFEERSGQPDAAGYRYFGNQHQVEGSYLEGFGVLFSVVPGFRFAATTLDGRRILRGTARGSDVIVIPDRRRIQTDEEGETIGAGKDSLAAEKRFREAVEAFVTGYAYLLRQLPAGEKIMIRYGANPASMDLTVNWAVAMAGYSPERAGVLSAMISKADLDAFQSGRLGEEQLLTRIRFTADSGPPKEEDRDLTLLAGIFNRLYKDDLSETFRLQGPVHYERIEGLGTLYFLTIWPSPGSPAVFSLDGSRLRFRDGGGVTVQPSGTPDEETPSLEDAYPAFLKDLKSNIVEYGSIVKNLAPGEALIFRIKLPECPGCVSMPQKLEITCRQATLDNYRKNKIDLDTAVGQLTVSQDIPSR